MDPHLLCADSAPPREQETGVIQVVNGGLNEDPASPQVFAPWRVAGQQAATGRDA